jgi:hypothetical protein
MSPHDLLESELRAMRPRKASAELRRRIVDQLDNHEPIVSYRSWGIALAGGLAAACLAAISLWWSDDSREKTNDNVPSSFAVSPPVHLDLGPTVLAYRHALVRSPDHFSELLDEHAAVTLPHNPARNGIRAFVRPDTQQPSWTGEL